MGVRWKVAVVPLLAIACGARSGLLAEDDSPASGPDGSSGSGSKSDPGSGSGSGSGGHAAFEDYEPKVVAEAILPERAASPRLSLAMAPSGEAGALFFTTEEDLVGQARWFGDEWKTGLPGTEGQVRFVHDAWIADDGLRSWVSYSVGPSPGSFRSEVFSGGLPMGPATSPYEFQLPYRTAIFAERPQEAHLGPDGHAAAAFLKSLLFQYSVGSSSVSGDDSHLPFLIDYVLAAGNTHSGALIARSPGVVWEEARPSASDLTVVSTVVDGSSEGDPTRPTFVPYDLAYAHSDVAWAAWRVVPRLQEGSTGLMRIAQLGRAGDHRVWELSTILPPSFVRGGGLAVSRDGSVAALLWSDYVSYTTPARIAVVQDGTLIDAVEHSFNTRQTCDLSAPSLSAKGNRVIGSARCSDGSAYLFGVGWLVRLSGEAKDLPVVAVDESGKVGLVAWTELDDVWARYRIRTRTLVW